jgi:outer membrane protein TolC
MHRLKALSVILNSQNRWINFQFGTAIVASIALLAGCASSMDDIDAKVNAIIRERSDRIGGGAAGPAARPGTDDGTDDPALTDRAPSTRNPAASELRYDPAAESRDVAARLDGAIARSLEPGAEGLLELDLESSLSQAQRTSREFLSAEEDYILSAISLLIERHQWSPRFFNDTTVGIAGTGSDGDFDHALNVINTLRATQRLPYGGNVEARWIVNATEQLREQASGRYRQSSQLALDASIPLMRGAGEVAEESRIQAERDLVYAARVFERFRREFLVAICKDYFALLQTAAEIANQERQLQSVKLLEESTGAQVAAGQRSEFEKNIASNQVLTATASLASLRESYVLALDRFKVRLGLPVDRAVRIKPRELTLSEPEIREDEAVRLALEFRLDLQNSRDRLDDTRRGVKNARNQLLPDFNIAAGVGVPTPPDAREGGLNFDPDNLNYTAAATFGLPLDREIERLNLRRAMISLEQRERAYQQERDNIIVTVRSALRSIDLARFRLQLAEQQVVINQRRLEEQNLKIDTVEPQKIVDSQNELLSAENNRDQSRTNLRNAVLDYLLASDQLRVTPKGDFEPLPGMDIVRQAPTEQNAAPR